MLDSNNKEFQKLIDVYRSRFFKKTRGYELPELVYRQSYCSENTFNEIEFSVSLPLKNRERDIVDVLTVLDLNIDYPSELFLILDNCEDDTEKEVLRWIRCRKDRRSGIMQVHLLKSQGDIFESTCENIVFELSTGKYLVSMQADIYLDDATFFFRAKNIFEKNQDIFAISGEAIFHEANSKRQKMISFLFGLIRRIQDVLFSIFSLRSQRTLGLYFPGMTYYGSLNEYPKTIMIFTRDQLNTLFIGPTIVRGPIVWRGKSFKSLSGFNDHFFFLGRDEMEISNRAFKELGMFVGYLPCRAYSKLWEGTSHRPRSLVAQKEYDRRSDLAVKLNPGYFVPNALYSYPQKCKRKIQTDDE